MDALVRERLPQDREGPTIHFSLGGHDDYLTINEYPTDARPGEMFLRRAGVSGGDLALAFDLLAQAVSIGLQYGAPLRTFAEHWRGTHSAESCGFCKDTVEGINSASSFADFIAQVWQAKWPQYATGASVPPVASDAGTPEASGVGVVSAPGVVGMEGGSVGT